MTEHGQLQAFAASRALTITAAARLLMARGLEQDLGRPSDRVAEQIVGQLHALSRGLLAVLVASEHARLLVEETHRPPSATLDPLPAKAAYAARQRLVELEAAEVEL